MRELIRPALFWVVRLGLFFAVAAWVVAQWCFVEMTASGLGRSGRILVWPKETAIISEPTARQPGIRTWLYRDNNHPHSYSQSLVEQVKDTPMYSAVRPIRGITLVMDRRVLRAAVLIRHWLVVTIFAVFYGVLKWVYWERGRKAVGDE